MIKVMVFGTFDILHKGHINFLNQAKKHGDYLIVTVANDSNVYKIKNKNPLYTQEKRKKEIENLNIASKVIIGNKNIKKYFEIIKNELPNIICLGYDQDDLNLEKTIKENNLEIKIIRLKPYKEHIFKSSILKQPF